MKNLVTRFTNICNMNQEVLDKFVENMAKDPSYTLSWGDKAFQASARIKVARTVLELTDRVDSAGITKYVLDMVTQGARYPSMSTSGCANLMQLYETAAWAEALEVCTFGC